VLVALDWLLLVKPLLDAGLVALNLLGISVKWTLLFKSIDFINIENNGNGLHC
jgi:hypothetical protein